MKRMDHGKTFIILAILVVLSACATVEETRPTHEVENEGMVSVNGAELYYSARGTGPICLVLSAIGSEPYKNMTPPPLTDHLRLVHVDLRGSGRSTGDPADLTFDVLADDLEAIRTAMGAERVAILGHSILGVLAIEYGKRYPKSVSHVIVVGTPTHGDIAWMSEQGGAFFEEQASEERKQVLRENLANLPEGASMSDAMYAQTPMRFYDARFDAAPLFAGASPKFGLLQHLMGTLIPPAWTVRAEAGSLPVPIFIALGRHDYVVPHVLWDGLAEEFPQGARHLFEKSGHQPFFEEPEAFARSVSRWMANPG